MATQESTQTVASTPGKLTWYWNRLRCMSIAEFSHRIRQRLYAGVQQMGFGTAQSTPRPTVVETESWLHRAAPVSRDAYVGAARKVLDGSLRILSLDSVAVGRPPIWNRNPIGGQDVPLAFGKSINYRDQSLVGDIKYLWVLNRQRHLVTLAQAYSLTGDACFLDGIRENLRSWMDQCPYLRGPNWTSSSELAMRLIAWSAVWHLVGGASSALFEGDAGRAFREQWLEAIYRHAHFIRGNFSRFSSANNHLIGEAAGLFIATVTWPFWDVFANWRETARDELVREIELQNAPDGVNREHSVFYQRFVIEYFFYAALAARINGVEFPKRFWDRLESMLEFLASIMDVAGNIPMIGDSDNCSVLPLSTETNFCPYRSLLGVGAVMFRRPAFRAKAGHVDDGVLWLCGESGREILSSIDPDAEPLPVRQDFPNGGYFVLGSDFETDREVRIVADAGPLGYLSLAAHGHADALAFTLSVAGREFLVDPGTYAYQTKRKWRDYFRGTSAHNTLCVDGENQSLIGGSLLWLKQAATTREHWEMSAVRDRMVASHDGFTRLRDPVTHRRELVYMKPERSLQIRDTLICQGSHVAEMFWHFSERCEVVIEGGNLIAENGPAGIVLVPPRDCGELSLLKGCETPIGGWVSREFDVKTPSYTAVWRASIAGTADLTTQISVARL